MYIPRDFSKSEHDDFVLNVQSWLDDITWATQVYDDNGTLIGWEINSILQIHQMKNWIE